MGRAFQHDPLFVHACPDPSERARWLPWLFRWSAWKGFLYGQTLGTTGRLDGVVAIIGPGGGEFTEEQLTGFGYDQGRESVGPEVWDRSVAIVNAAFEPAEKPSTAPYRSRIGTWTSSPSSPAQQGRALAATVRAVSAQADAEEIPVVLLDLSANELSLYQRHGYQIICGSPPTSGLPWWGMRREPGS